MSSFKVEPMYRKLATQLDLYSTADLSDVKISCNGREFRAHSFVLAVASEFFRTMLNSSFKEGQAGHHLTLNNVSCDLMEKMLPYFYGAELEISYGNLLKVLELADMWMLDELKKACEKEFPTILTKENCLQMQKIAQSFRCPEYITIFCEKLFFARLDECLHTDEEFLRISRDLLKKYFVDYQCAINDEIDVLAAIHRWWKFGEEDRTKYLKELIASCVRQEDVDKDGLTRYISFLKPYVTEDNPFVSCALAIPSQETPKFPLARCGRKKSQDGIVFASITNNKLSFVRCKISGNNNELVFCEERVGPHNVQDIVLSGQHDWLVQENTGANAYKWYAFNSSKHKEKLDYFSADFVARKEGCPGLYVVGEECINDAYLLKTLKVHEGQIEWIGPSERIHEEDLLTLGGALVQHEYVAFSNTLVAIYRYDDGDLEVRILDLQTFELVKTTIIDENVERVKAVAQNTEYVVIITLSKCLLFSVSEFIETGTNAVTKFPLYSANIENDKTAACIVGQLLVVGHRFFNHQYFSCCDLNTVLTYVKQKEATSLIWRRLEIPYSFATAKWRDRLYLVQEKGST